MTKINAVELSKWIIHNLPPSEQEDLALTPLKLQKLLFYCYGISIAKGFDYFSESMSFEAWKHGPVSRTVYEKYNNSPITNEPYTPFPEDLNLFLKNVLYIYGSLDAWKIRQQSHLEAPWKTAFHKGKLLIDKIEIKNYFAQKYFSNAPIYGPEYVFDLSSFTLDGIPTVGYSSFEELAAAAKRIFFQNI